MQKDYYVYMVECENGMLYTGYTVDVEKRFNEHKSGKRGAKFTKAFKPVRVSVSWKVHGGRGDAMRIEAFIKSLTKSEKTDLSVNPEILIERLKGVDTIKCDVVVS